MSFRVIKFVNRWSQYLAFSKSLQISTSSVFNNTTGFSPSVCPPSSLSLSWEECRIVEDRGGGDLERKKERKWTSVSETASFFALILSPQAARCSQARCYMATIRRAESQHLVLPNLWQLTVHTHTHTHTHSQVAPLQSH